MTNPLQFIDDIFTGIVQFIFSVFDSLKTLLASPLRGTLRLAVRYKHNKSTQISYTTILFLLNSANYLLYRLPSGNFLPTEANSIFQNLKGDAVINLLIYATAATALQQWWIASQTSKKLTLSKPDRASLKLGYLFSSCAAIWLVFQVAPFAALYLVDHFRVFDHLKSSRLFEIAGNIMIIVSFALGFLLVSFISYKGRCLAPHKNRNVMATLPIVLIMTQLISYIFPSVFEKAKGPPLQITALSCKLSNSSYLDVDAVVTNLTDITLILKTSHISVLGERRDLDGKLYNRTSIPVDTFGYLSLEVDQTLSEFIVLEPQRATTLKLKSETWPGPPSDWGNRLCGLDILATESTNLYGTHYEMSGTYEAGTFESRF